MDEFLEAYADSGGAVDDYESSRQQFQAVAERNAQLQEAQERQRQFVSEGQGLEELRGAKSLADFMLKCQKAGGVTGGGWTIAEDPSTGQPTVVEVD
jgi:hypothetical protein